MAQVLDVKTGDWVEIQHYLPGRENEMVQVAGQVKQTLGMNGYMDLDYLGALLFENGLVNGVYLDSDDPLIQQKLIKASNISSVMSSKDSQAVYQEYMTMTYLSIAFMVLFSGVLGFAIVYNATMVNLSSRELEFSSLRVMGFTRKEIFQLILKENNILLGVGILLGIPVGRWFSYYSSEAFTTDIYHLDLSPSLNAYVLATIYTILFILLAQLATYRKIQKLDFLKALKSRES
jgi:putative ABC transport system permease protein